MTTEHDLIQSLTNALEVLYKEAVTAPYSQTLVIGGIAHPIPIGNDLLARDAIYADLLFRARAYLDQPEPVPVSADTAFAIGLTGGPPSEVERLAFEAWMRGHSWLVSGKWNGTTYVDPQERHNSIDLLAMQTRMLWAAWRDRAALARCGRPAIKPVPVSERSPKAEDCDSEGRCWGWMNAEHGWNLYSPEHLPEWSFWLRQRFLQAA